MQLRFSRHEKQSIVPCHVCRVYKEPTERDLVIHVLVEVYEDCWSEELLSAGRTPAELREMGTGVAELRKAGQIREPT